MDLWLPPKPAIIRPAPERKERMLPYRKPVPVQRGMLVATPYIGLGVGGGGVAASLSFLQFTSDAVNRTTYNFLTQNFGAEDPTRVIIAAVVWSGDDTLNSASIGGVAATIHIQNTELFALAPADQPSVALISAAVPTGTTGTVSLTFSASANNAGIGLYRVVDLGSQTPFATASNDTDIVAMSLNIPDNGVVAACAMFLDATSMTTTGVTEDFDATVEVPTPVQRAGGGSLTGQPAQSGLSISFDGATGKYTHAAGVAASWS